MASVRTLAVVVILAGAALAAACGSSSAGPGVANIGSSTQSTAQATGGAPGGGGQGKGFAQMLAFARCMRSHGVASFPDPVRRGNGAMLTLTGGQGLDPRSATFQSAQSACRSLLPGRGTGPAVSAQQRQQALAFSRCIRAHGVPNFPDPSFSGGGVRIGGAGLDPRSPRMQAAMRACRSNLPILGG